MGTRSITIVKEKELKSKNNYLVMYRQMDGHPETHGYELASFLNGMKIVNGIPYGEDTSQIANGMDCLAAQIVAYFKDGPGSIYLCPSNELQHECFDYYVYLNKGNKIMIKCMSGDETLFKGTPKQYLKWVNK